MRKNLIGIANLHISTIVLLNAGTVQTLTHLAIQSIQFNMLFKSHLSITGHNTHIKQSYNNKLESHSLQNRCPLYNTFRDHLFNIACTFNGIKDNQKLVFLFSDFNNDNHLFPVTVYSNFFHLSIKLK
jgi:hypothetical protein